ncbi:MAG: T9SS type A sorting domain-containing protein [Saprospiraceae bacterium]
MLPCKVGTATANRSKQHEATSAVALSTEEQLFAVSPNPATDQLLVRFGRSFTGTLSLVDATGSVVRSRAITVLANDNLHLDVLGLPNGIFYLHANDGSTKPVAQKVIILR